MYKISPKRYPGLYKSHQERLNEREIFRQKTLNDIFHYLDHLSEKYNFKQIIIFGSLIKEGLFGRYSDVDIAVEGLNKYDLYKFIGDLSLEIGKEVDVVRLEECHFADEIKLEGIKWSRKK